MHLVGNLNLMHNAQLLLHNIIYAFRIHLFTFAHSLSLSHRFINCLFILLRSTH